MNILIAYAGKTGTTHRCASMLADKIPGAVLASLDTTTPAIDPYDVVIVGSNIRVGKFGKRVTRFLTANNQVLQAKMRAFFICCGFAANADEYFKTNVPPQLLRDALCVQSFGGQLSGSEIKGFDKFVVSMVSRRDPAAVGAVTVDMNAIDTFAKCIAQTAG